MNPHSNRSHAILSASGAERWMNCPPSARIEEKIGGESSSVFAEEGTLAHEFAEIGVLRAAGEMHGRTYNAQVKKLKAHELYDEEMDEYVQQYVDIVMELFNAKKDAKLFVEKKIDLSDYVPEGFGSVDCNIVADRVMDVIDLKFGKGIEVSAVDNSQLKLYALGALEEFDIIYDIETIRLHIIQPRIGNYSSWEIPAKDLYTWGENVIKFKAREAYNGKGVQRAGKWCKWCKAKAQCATLASSNINLAKHAFCSPHLLSDDQIEEVYEQVPMLLDWADAVGKYIKKEALAGKAWEKFKLVAGRSSRKWADEEGVEKVLKDRSFGDDEIFVKKLIGIDAAEKLVGKKEFAGIFGNLVTKPEGAPTLVTMSDSRKALVQSSAEDDFADLLPSGSEGGQPADNAKEDFEDFL